MHKIDPNLLRTFIAVMETGSLTSAAKVVEKTTAAVFYQIARLEAALDQKLFIRDKRRLRPSRMGDQFLLQAYALLNHHDQILDGKWSRSGASARRQLSR